MPASQTGTGEVGMNEIGSDREIGIGSTGDAPRVRRGYPRRVFATGIGGGGTTTGVSVRHLFPFPYAGFSVHGTLVLCDMDDDDVVEKRAINDRDKCRLLTE